MTSRPLIKIGANAWAAAIGEADGYVLVTGEHDHGYPAPIKNALDLLFAEWARKPVAFLSYGGGAGGVRAVEQLRLCWAAALAAARAGTADGAALSHVSG